MTIFPDYKELLQYEVVFFDLDNTIYQYEPAHQPALNVTLRRFAEHYQLEENFVSDLYNISRKRIHERLHGQASSHSRLLYFKEMIAGLEKTRNFSDALTFEKTYWQHFLSVMTIDQGALNLIKKLHRKNIPMGIITDLTTQIQLQKMKKLKIEKYFRHVITSEETGIEKPDPAIFRFALHKFGANADQSIMIGDNAKTDKGSEAIGMKCILI